jgi:uncharacterized lipoprotein YajG
MKTARFLLACVAVSMLAACSTDSITAPAAPRAPAADGTPNCVKIIVVNPDGTTTERCATDGSSQLGSGG